MRISFIGLFCSLILAAAPAVAGKYKLTLSNSRKDGITVAVTPSYTHIGTVYITMSPAACYNSGVPKSEVDLSSTIGLLTWNWNMSGFIDSNPMLDVNAPAGVNLCYFLVGRGQVEASAWGYRKADWEETLITPSVLGLAASKNRTDAIEITMNPPLQEFSDLYVAPVEDNNCPDIGKPFDFTTGRWKKVMKEPFNGKYYLDKNAPIAIDVCYFVIARKSQLTVAKAVGYREP